MKKILLIFCIMMLVGCSLSNEKENNNQDESDSLNLLEKYKFKDYSIEQFHLDYQKMLEYFIGSGDIEISRYVEYEGEVTLSNSFISRFNNYNTKDYQSISRAEGVDASVYVYKGKEYLSDEHNKNEVNSETRKSLIGYLHGLRIKPEYVVSSQVATIEDGKIFYVELKVVEESIIDYFTEDSNPYLYRLLDDKVELFFETDNELKIKKILSRFNNDIDGDIYKENQELKFNSYEYQEIEIPSDIEEWSYLNVEWYEYKYTNIDVSDILYLLH